MYDVWEGHIFPWLGIHEILALRATSRELRDAVDSSRVWKRFLREEYGLWLDKVPDARELFFQRAQAQLTIVEYPGDRVFPSVYYFTTNSASGAESKRDKRGIGRLAKWSGMSRKSKDTQPAYAKSMAVNILEFARLSFGGSVYVTTHPGKGKHSGKSYQLKCPNNKRIVQLGTAVATLAAIDTDGSLYIYKEGELKSSYVETTFYAVKSCPWVTKLVCYASTGLVAIETENESISEPTSVTKPCEGRVIDYAVISREPLWVIYATEHDLHFVELTVVPAKPPVKLGAISELTHTDAPIVRIEAAAKGPEFWALNSKGQGFEGILDLGRPNPLVSLWPMELPGTACELSIGEFSENRYAHALDGRVYTFDGSIVDRVPTYKIAEIAGAAVGLCGTRSTARA